MVPIEYEAGTPEPVPRYNLNLTLISEASCFTDVDSKLSVNVSAQTGKRANVYFAHRIHLRRDTFNASLQQRKEKQTDETNK